MVSCYKTNTNGTLTSVLVYSSVLIGYTMMGVLPSCNNKLYIPAAGVLLYSFYTWILLSAMPIPVYSEGNQTLTNITTDASWDNSSWTMSDEGSMSTTESTANTTTINNITKTPEDDNNNQVTDDSMDNQNTSTTFSSFDTSSQSVDSSTSTFLLSTTLPQSSVTGSEENINNTTLTIRTTTTTTTVAVTNVSLDYSKETVNITEATGVTSTTDVSTTASLNISNLTVRDDRTKSGGFSKIKLTVITVTAATSFFVLIFVIAIIVYFHGGRFRQTKRHTDKEYIDCDHELYTSLSVYTNFRHHGARAAHQPFNLKDDRLITKMEVDEVDDNTCTDNHAVMDVEETADSGRCLSPEGLIYVTVQHSNGKSKASSKTQKDDNSVHYATIDIDKTNKLFARLQKHESNKKKRREEYRKKR